MIQIGDTSLITSRPVDIGAQLLVATGCGIAEVRRQLLGHPLAQHVARALRPFLVGDGAPDVGVLTGMIADAGLGDIAGQVAALLADVPQALAEDVAHG